MTYITSGCIWINTVGYKACPDGHSGCPAGYVWSHFLVLRRNTEQKRMKQKSRVMIALRLMPFVGISQEFA